MYLKLINLSIGSLSNNRVRALLTMLGIVIGAATIILVIAMGEGAKNDIDEQFSNMSVTTILINAPSNADGEKSKLDIDDSISISNLENISAAVPQLTGKIAVSSNGEFASFDIIGSTEDVFAMMNTDLVTGRVFTSKDDEDRAKVAVLGSNVVEEFFGDPMADVVGKEIILGKKKFEIIGSLVYKGGAFGPTTIDESVFVPYSAAYRYVLGTKGKFNINAMASDVDILDRAMEDIAVVLRESHKIKIGGIDDFRIRDMGSNVQAAKDSARTMSLLLGSVGFVVLLVGGIGIMNIMYVTVSERTREIGLRKAIGAKDRYIELQFLFEAILLSIAGYFIGAILATIIYFVLQELQISVYLVWWSYLLSFLFVMVTGVFFGFAPAKKAAAMNPIDALRHE
ncbi:hypothetical protein COV58_00725 [Candidatus Roizmanbacteria bacterium CG11_big_fil_rev_8_21_14_0_20_36_8]|uniref:Multidrug ABC transporter substrate-binding protein n=2 Tax=Candidatus Roizmaniibacteriota TaxID=1752723 RepID=A0A2M6IV42_9BACT|nr:MAG: hypothetical protein COV58_00725 [Candidatus Roizmanbacteria bacterium CG11_big_fil_rev_8_21_14_0_20_36_8]PIZ64471.1 MAG: hypothetical protein COY14_04655 [Candidatus Roizmanbacteria bacterium CG_4_10_14_0_2_um_filter_36_9]